MATLSIYLNFQGNTKEAFTFYKSVFNTELIGDIIYMKDTPPMEGAPPLSKEDGDKVMHACLPTLGGINIMGTDMLESMGQKVKIGNNITINLEPDSKDDADKLYNLLSQGATDCAPMSHQFWGYWGCCLDRFGIRWMLNFAEKNK